jgi:Spy/CpxP family protein refolding chaperone
VGALRDLAVETNSNVPTGSQPPSQNGRTTNDPQSGGEISERYDELQRLRQQVKMAESLALKSQKRQFLLTAFAGGLRRPFHTRSPRDVPSGS